MAIHVTLSTTLRDCIAGYDPMQGLDVDADGVCSAMELAIRVGLPPAEVKIAMINGRSRPLDEAVADGDRVAFFPAVGGG